MPPAMRKGFVILLFKPAVAMATVVKFRAEGLYRLPGILVVYPLVRICLLLQSARGHT